MNRVQNIQKATQKCRTDQDSQSLLFGAWRLGNSNTPTVFLPLLRNNIIALGCSDGIVQLAHSISARLLGTFNEPSAPSGIIHIEVVHKQLNYTQYVYFV